MLKTKTYDRFPSQMPSSSRRMPLQRASAVDAILSSLEMEGVQYLFGVPGASLTPIYESISRGRRIRQILTKHEEGAALMAGGYARVRRGLAACCATTGPGGTNCVTGIASARADSLPVMLITGQSSTRFFGKGAFQESSSFGTDLVQLFKPITKLSVMVPSAERIPEMMQNAIRVALSGRPGPVHVNIPADFLKDHVDYTARSSRGHYRSTGSPVDRDSLLRAAKLLVDAKRPAILVGHGASMSGASSELLELAERLHIPVATSPKAKGFFPEDHPLSLGVFGFAGHPRAESFLLAEWVDVLLVIGTGLGEWTTNAWNTNLRPTRALIQIDIDPEALGRNYALELGIVGDARGSLRQLNEHVSELLIAPAFTPQDRDDDPLELLREEVPRYNDAEFLEGSDSPMKPQQLVQEMQSAMPDNAMLFVDIGNAMTWAGHYFESRLPHTYHVSMGLASMGSAISGAIGGKLAAPDTPVVALVGDAAFAMNGIEVHTAVEHEIPVVWIVLNNAGHGMIMHGERILVGRQLDACNFRVPIDIHGLAKALGAQSSRVKTREEFREAFKQALAAKVPWVIDAEIDREVVPCALAGRAKTLAASFDHMPLSMRQPNWPK